MYSKSSSDFSLITTYISFVLIIAIGYIQDIASKLLTYKYNNKVPILSDLQTFYSRNCLKRVVDCAGFPIHGRPSRIIQIIERKWNVKTKEQTPTGKLIPCINFGSYNYLGFADTPPILKRLLYKTLNNCPINIAACSRDVGKHGIVKKLEKAMASFLHKEDCVVFSMGYGTNTSNIHCLLTEETLVFSDHFNHASIITGLKMSKATIKTFKHNDMDDLENKLIYEISQGQSVTHRSWQKIIVFVEGIYSMEGTICNLKKLVELKKKYKFYIFIDEAHSIGAIGETGRGICEYANVNYNDIDILMGTFTKSFAGMGGYIAASKQIIDYFRVYSDFSRFGDQMSPLVATQILGCLKILSKTKLGVRKLERLRRNTVMMREGLKKLNLVVVGDDASPVIPLIISHPGKLCELSRICQEEGIGVVIVGYPGTSILYGRLRLCVSSSHTTKDIKKTLDVIRRANDLLGLPRYTNRNIYAK